MRVYFLVGMLFWSGVSAAQPSADSILQTARDRNDGYSYVSTVVLRLIDSKKKVRERAFYMLQKDINDSEERALMSFHSPSDVRGVSFLITNYDEEQSKADDQWMYLPAFRKTRRIGSNDKRGSFMGSVFNYSDLDNIRVKDYDNTLLAEETIGDRSAWRIERIPVNQAVISKTGYYKTHVWIDKQRHIVLQQHYFNAKGIVFKTQETIDVDNLQDIWTITKSRATDIEKNKQSEMLFLSTVYNVDISEEKINQRSLKRGIQSNDIPERTK